MDESDEETIPISHSVYNQDPYRGARISAVIEGETFYGQVEGMEKGERSGQIVYRIRYEDNDLEHYTLEQLEKSILLPQVLTVHVGYNSRLPLLEVKLTTIGGDEALVLNVVSDCTLERLRGYVRAELNARVPPHLVLPCGLNLGTWSPSARVRNFNSVAGRSVEVEKLIEEVKQQNSRDNTSYELESDLIREAHFLKAGLLSSDEELPDSEAEEGFDLEDEGPEGEGEEEEKVLDEVARRHDSELDDHEGEEEELLDQVVGEHEVEPTTKKARSH